MLWNVPDLSEMGEYFSNCHFVFNWNDVHGWNSQAVDKCDNYYSTNYLSVSAWHGWLVLNKLHTLEISQIGQKNVVWELANWAKWVTLISKFWSIPKFPWPEYRSEIVYYSFQRSTCDLVKVRKIVHIWFAWPMACDFGTSCAFSTVVSF